MTKIELVKDVAKEQGISQATTLRVINSFIEHIKLSLRMRDEVIIRDFGKFHIKRFKPHKLTHIKTGEPYISPASDNVVFKQSRHYDVNSLV